MGSARLNWNIAPSDRGSTITMSGDFSDPETADQAVLRLREAAEIQHRSPVAPGPWRWWVRSAQSAHEEIANRAGWTRVRTLYLLDRDLDRQDSPDDELNNGPEDRPARPGTSGSEPQRAQVDHHPGAIAIRPFGNPGDADALLAINNAAFDWHPDQRDWTITQLNTRLAAPWVDLANVLMADDGGRVLGFCWVRIHHSFDDDHPTGEIYLIAVDPQAHGRGLGSLLVRAGLDLMVTKGCARAILWCEAENSAALSMYRSLGFSVHSTDVAYASKPLDPSTDQSSTKALLDRPDESAQAEPAQAESDAQQLADITQPTPVVRPNEPAPEMQSRPTRTAFDLSRNELTDLLGDQPSYRIDQVWTGWYRQHLPTGKITTLPKRLRQRVDEMAPASLFEADHRVGDHGDTHKLLWRLGDGELIETVLMHYPDRSTVCVSTQAGCAMRCDFCATGQAGYRRQLSVGEIVEQVIAASRIDPERRVSNVVFMGMGEPLANFDAVWNAVERLHGDVGISARHLTISTVGIVPGIERLAAASLPVNLAVSLHAATDELRDRLVPINRRYPLARLEAACADYRRMKGRRLSFEWALIDGVNDNPEQAAALAALARRLAAHINLIPLNPTPGYAGTATSMRHAKAFQAQLTHRGANATIRANRGTDIDAACGQLRASAAAPSSAGDQRVSLTKKGPAADRM